MESAGGGHGAPTTAEGADFTEVAARLRAGDDDAAREVYAHWAKRLIGLTRARMGRAIAAREEAEDVVQSVYRSFFRRYRAAGYHVEDWRDVWALLATIARRKCANRRSYHAAGCRATSRQTPMELADPVSTEPTPEEGAVLAETVEQILSRVRPGERAIVELSLQGYTVKEISDRVGLAERTVYRVREHVRKWLLDQAGRR